MSQLWALWIVRAAGNQMSPSYSELVLRIFAYSSLWLPLVLITRVNPSWETVWFHLVITEIKVHSLNWWSWNRRWLAGIAGEKKFFRGLINAKVSTNLASELSEIHWMWNEVGQAQFSFFRAAVKNMTCPWSCVSNSFHSIKHRVKVMFQDWWPLCRTCFICGWQFGGLIRLIHVVWSGLQLYWLLDLLCYVVKPGMVGVALVVVLFLAQIFRVMFYASHIPLDSDSTSCSDVPQACSNYWKRWMRAKNFSIAFDWKQIFGVSVVVGWQLGWYQDSSDGGWCGCLFAVFLDNTIITKGCAWVTRFEIWGAGLFNSPSTNQQFVIKNFQNQWVRSEARHTKTSFHETGSIYFLVVVK